MQFEIDSIFSIAKISSGENIIFSRGPPKTIPVLVECGDQIKDKINGEMFMDTVPADARAISIIAFQL